MEPLPSLRQPGDSRPADATGTLAAVYVRPSRWPIVGAVLLGLVLVGVPAYLWTRPRTVSVSVGGFRGAEEAVPAERPAEGAAMQSAAAPAGTTAVAPTGDGAAPHPTKKRPTPKGR